MKNVSNKMRGPALIIVAILVFLFANYTLRQQRNERNSSFNQYGMFTLGCVVDYQHRISGAPGTNTSPSIKFAYKVQGQNYVEESDYYVPDENGPQVGSMFMAVYLPANPQKAALLLNYPVKNADDFNKYLEEFKTNRPKFDK